MTKQPKAVRAWAVWYKEARRPYVQADGAVQVYETKKQAEYQRDSWYHPTFGPATIRPVLITPATPKRRSKK